MRVLIVDDDAAIIEVIRDSVNWEKLGIEDVETACNVERARALLNEKMTDIVISDIEMPKESGLDLLKWFREEKLPGKFLLLTCHESFQYATEAIRYHAEEYLMKPFNVEIMELVLQKILQEIRKEKLSEESSTRRDWTLQNVREVQLSFWTALFSGRVRNTREDIQWELDRRSLFLDCGKRRRLVITRVTNMEVDTETYGTAMVLFILENLHSEILRGKPENDRVVSFEHNGFCSFLTVCEEGEDAFWKEKCEELIRKCGGLLNSTLTCFISEPCEIGDFYELYRRSGDIFARNILYYGKAFLESEAASGQGNHQGVLQLEKMTEYLESGSKLGFMDYLKKELEAKRRMNALDGEMLRSMRQEIQQAVYVHLAQKGIQVSLLLSDEASRQMSEKASQSVIDMIRWGNYLLSRVFEYEEEVQKAQTIVEKINLYIQEHYKENIGRNEIGAYFYLVPEYLAKMYKKKTGKSLKDYINEYRLEQARFLLAKKEMLVSDVAAEVGFDNFSYFSTMFKKTFGMTANEYRKQL